MTDECVSSITVGAEGDPVYVPTQRVIAEHGIFGNIRIIVSPKVNLGMSVVIRIAVDK